MIEDNQIVINSGFWEVYYEQDPPEGTSKLSVEFHATSPSTIQYQTLTNEHANKNPNT